MPNNMRQDFVPVHLHSPGDVPGLARAVLGPPTEVVLGTTSGPTQLSATFADLAEMTETVTPPSNYARWEVRVSFSTAVLVDTDQLRAATKLVQDGTDVPNSTRSSAFARPVSNPHGDGELSNGATVYADGGVPTTVKVQWSNITAGGSVLTAVGTERRMEVSMRPVTGV